MMNDRNIAEMQFGFQPESDELDLNFWWRVAQSRRWFIFTIAAVTLALSTIYVLRLPNVYTARTKILVQSMDQSAFQNPEMLKPRDQYGMMYYQTRAEVLKSRHILEQAAEQLNLKEYYHVDANQKAASFLRSFIHVEILRDTQIIQLTVTHRDPEMAQKIANTVSEVFVRESWRERLFISDQLLKWFPTAGKTLEKSSAISQLQELDKESAVMSLPSILQDPVVSRIKQDRLAADSEIQELSRRYTEKHPKMKELRARADYLESQMNAQIEKVIAGLKSGLAGEFSVSNVKVIDDATLPAKPSGPPRLRIVLMSTVLALLGSIVFAALLYHLDQNIKSEEDVRKIPLTFLGYLPLFGGLNGRLKSDVNKLTNLLDRVLSDMSVIDDVTNVRAATLFSMPAERSKLLMYTSAVPGEGKTTIASMFAISLAKVGERVLLIDADMRKPSLHQVFNLKNERGLSNCLVGSSRPSDVIQAIEKVPSLHVITAGEKTPSPATLLGSRTIDRLIQELESNYDRIIFDVPPSLHIADGLILAGKVHGIVLVFQVGKVHQDIGRKLKERIYSAGGTILGAVVNQVNYKQIDYPYYRYYRQYSKYYDSPKQSVTRRQSEERHPSFSS